MSSCDICHTRDTPTGDRSCLVCADDLRGWLTELPRQAQLLEEEFVAPAGGRAAGRLGGTGRAHAPVPVDLRVLTLLGPGHPGPVGHPDDDTDTTVPIHAFLDGWAGHIAYTYPAVARDPHGTARSQPCEQAWPSYGATITGWCTWHLAYLPYTLTLPAVTDLHRDLGDLIRRIRDLTHTVPHRHHKDAPCPACGNFRLAAVDGQHGITCQACGHHLDPDAYNQHAANLLATLHAR